MRRITPKGTKNKRYGTAGNSAQEHVAHKRTAHDSADGGPAFAPFNVPGDYATRTTIADDPDSVPLEGLHAWTINTEAVAEHRARIADLIITLQ